MDNHSMLTEILSEVKEVKEEVKKINGRVIKLETDSYWRHKHITWISSLGLFVAGVFSKIGIDWVTSL